MYDHRSIEQKWQQLWQESGIYRTREDLSKPKYYILDMFPYPSGEGLHVGHPKGYIATDIIARLRLMKGYDVLHPMGWDAFGLPAENYAIKNKVHPRLAMEKNVINYKRQLNMLGFCYDWEREINTTDPEYYRWTQWIFLQMWKKGLAYESHAPINWCPSCKTGLANEDVEDGHCERCGTLVEQKPMRQWVLKITDYADRLLDDLEKLPEWDPAIKDMQRNWIGRSEGADINFKIKDSDQTITVFTTRVDTIFGCSYVVLAPEHKLVTALRNQITNWSDVEAYIETTKNKTDLQRTDLNKDKTGVKLEGLLAINPFNGEEVPVYVADYVLNGYGTGAVMAVPAHDERDLKFANKYDLPIKGVVTETGILHDSGKFSDLTSEEARKQMTVWLEKEKLGSKRVNYKINDWVYSRQRYWGEPIPLLHCEKCGVVGVPEEQLPVVLPDVESYEPTGTGESPLAAITDWVETTCPTCGGPAKRETNTMPQWGGSCWYYLRYLDPKNNNELVSKEKEARWSPVDLYVGGAEHATRHLIYARFWHKFLFDIGVVTHEEPFTKLQHVGLIVGEDGRKMSKRWGNVINPDNMAERFGADALRVYEMFMGPFDQAAVWNTNGISGTRKFLEKIEKLCSEQVEVKVDKKILSLLHKTIKKVGDDIENFRFNTAVSALMILVNELTDYYTANNAWALTKEDMAKLLQMIAPFAPHLAEELWEKLGYKQSIFKSSWPLFDANLVKDEVISYMVQINGKLRGQVEMPAEASEDEVIMAATTVPAIVKWLEGKEIRKKIFVPGRLVNFVI
ncbi:leucine--tRNA ligase [Candidatus Falkowbacteria bacterium HGW-Falkowbacteria-2]|uniref:Leucine--tRNA ligase n=1 Tax=Candidatus Falkowbacteria bacterium HGW-Falkowbacteria-2 TaxID=2013769 RepID=A0A2N2E0K2_9BACT|nr:MAG: leucine--tRNA ligase [Candidatus Falkowbacteria bacterium HGW-Falkowbacteria-2]